MTYQVVTFYRFFEFPDYQACQGPWLAACQQLGLKGTILLAAEGLNATLAGETGAIAQLLDLLQQDPRLAQLSVRSAVTDQIPFERMKVKLKAEIVTLGQPDADPRQRVGTYISPQDWNQLLADPDVTVIDTRNDYEVEIGTFTGAINPQTHSFREFVTYVDQNLDPTQNPKVALFCTGGIRCEKATAYLLNHGFAEVYHLHGGILNYLTEVPLEQSWWQGECFVFDERVAVRPGLQPGSYGMCQACGRPVPLDRLSDLEQVPCGYCQPQMSEC